MDSTFQFPYTSNDSNWIMSYSVHALDSPTWPMAIGILVGVLLLAKHSLGDVGRPKLPTGPLNWPVVGALFSLGTDPRLHHGFTRMAKKYGPIFYYRHGQHDVIVVSSVEGAEEVLKHKDQQFANRPNTTLLKTVAKYLGFDKQNFGFSDYNDHLRTLRKVVTMQFFTKAKLSTFESLRRYEGAVMIEGIRSQLQDDGGAKINFRECTVFMSTNIICTMLFGKRFSHATSDEFKHYQDMAHRFVDLILSFNPGDLFPSLEWLMPRGKLLRYEKFQEDLKQFIGTILEEHRQVKDMNKGYEDVDLVDILITLEKDGQISENEVMGCIIDMLSAGIDTTSTTAEWALLELVRHPECMEKLKKEIDAVVGKDRQVEESDFENLPYLEAVFKETFRFHHPAPLLIPRCNRVPTTLGGYYVPADTTVFVNVFAIGRDPQLWESPGEFQPARFIGSPFSNMSVTGGSCQFLPFGTGKRMCVGYNLGKLVTQRMIASLVHSFDWSPPAGQGIQDLSTKDVARIVTQPAEPLVLSAIPRLEPNVYCAKSLVDETLGMYSFSNKIT